MEDAVDLSRTIIRFPDTPAEKRASMLREYVDTMRARRLKERKRSAFVMNLCFFGTTPLRASVRDYGMEIANVWLAASGLVRLAILVLVIGAFVGGIWGLNGEFLKKLAEGLRQVFATK
ncbi:hypothetical protein BFJ70_g2880 [Fusarium oxysporum]|nr:hypothetical protein BFJ70_g2880 [Fusarium oxysporum]